MQLAAPRLVPPLQKLEFESTHPKQTEYNQAIPSRLEVPDESARERVEDAILFATWMSPNQPAATIAVSPEPVIHLEGEEKGIGFHIHLCHGHFGYSVNNSPLVTVEDAQARIAVGRKLLTVWDTLIKHLPEGFIIYGPDVSPGAQGFEERERILQGLGFGAAAPDGDRFGIVRGGKVTPLSEEEVANFERAGGISNLFNQRLMVEEIIWDTEE